MLFIISLCQFSIFSSVYRTYRLYHVGIYPFSRFLSFFIVHITFFYPVSVTLELRNSTNRTKKMYSYFFGVPYHSYLFLLALIYILIFIFKSYGTFYSTIISLFYFHIDISLSLVYYKVLNIRIIKVSILFINMIRSEDVRRLDTNCI